MFGFKRSVSPALPLTEAIARVGTGEMILIDVRDHAELSQSGQAEGALHIPLGRLPMVADPRHPDLTRACPATSRLPFIAPRGPVPALPRMC